MTVLKVSATPGIVTTKIGSWADICAGCPWGGVVWISNWRRSTEYNLWSGYHSRSSPTMPGKLLSTKITHSLRVFPHKIDSGNPIMTFSGTNLQSIAAATEVKVFPRPISSATSAPGISASLTHLLTSVSNGSKFPGRFRVRFHPKPDRGNGSYHTKNPDRCHWAGFTTKNPAFQFHNFGSN